MIIKEITLAGKTVNITFCLATEITFKNYTGISVTEFIAESDEAIKQKKIPDVEKSVCLILAAVIPCYEKKGKKAPIQDKDIIYDVTAEEFNTAVAEIVLLYTNYYHIPTGDKKQPTGSEEDGKKNS